MAAKKKSGRWSGNKSWKASPDDAIRLAALRWLSIEIEQLSTEIYATDKVQYAVAEDHIRDLIRQLRAMKPAMRLGALADDEDCPDGYKRCNDGFCAPICSDEEA